MNKQLKNIISVFSIFLMIAGIFIALPIPFVKAQIGTIGGTPDNTVGLPKLGPLPQGVTPQYTFEQTAYISITPNPIGLGQQALVNFWTSPGMYHCFYGQGYKVTIQKPDGSTETVGPFNSYLGDDTDWFQYTVNQVGTWRFKFEAPGTYIPAGQYIDRPGTTDTTKYNLGASVYYTPCATDWQNLTVQENMVASWPSSPLPTDYWTRPIYPDNRDWWPIAGNYPWTGVFYYPNGQMLYSSNYRYTAYVQAPNTAHIVWRQQGAISGLLGAEQYQNSISGNPGTPDIIFQGRCYQSYSKPGSGKTAVTYWKCYDLRTGQLYWERPLETGETAPTQITYEQGTSNVAGAEASLSTSVSLVAISGGYLRKYNPWTGAMTVNCSTPGISTGQFPIYNNAWVLSIQTISTSKGQYRLINWTVAGSSTNFASRIGTNISWPIANLGTDAGRKAIDYSAGISAQFIWSTPPGSDWCIGYNVTAVDLYTGKVLWASATNDTAVETMANPGSPIIAHGKLAFAAQNRHWCCFDARTGAKVWDSELTTYPWGNWWPYSVASYDFNESASAIITGSYSGIWAIDWATGKNLWNYIDPDVPFETPYGSTPFFTEVTLADGKVYAYNGEHTQSQPLARGWKTYCLNATTGELIWKITGPMTPGAVADGYLTAANPYDGYTYAFGKGKSATTVTAPDIVVEKGKGIVIKSTVLDISPGAPNTPCVSVDSMATQMEYLYMQHPIDGIWHNETINGVPVTLTAIDSNGDVTDIDTVTTNGYYGTFGYTWTPPNEGDYTIMASFAGDGSYGSSSAATAISVGKAQTAAPTATQAPQVSVPDYTMTIIAGVAAILIAIFVVGAVLFRKIK